MSIDLCKTTGAEAASFLTDKLARPELSIRVGSFAIAEIVEVAHYDDGMPVIEAIDVNEARLIFQFVPDNEPFATSAVDQDGNPVCVDC